MIVEKLKYIRVLRIALGLSEAELYRQIGNDWKTWQPYHVNRLERLVYERQRRIFNFVGDDDFGISEAMEKLIAAIQEASGAVKEDLRDYLMKRGRVRVVTVLRSLGESHGYTDKDLYRAARDIRVRREQEKEHVMGKRGKWLKPRTLTYWSLPDEE